MRKSLAELQAAELAPFAYACRESNRSVDDRPCRLSARSIAKLPATLSEAIVTGLLRHQLGYDGVVFSDDMEMTAISDRYGVEESATSLRRPRRRRCPAVLPWNRRSRRAFEFLCAEADRDATVRARIEESYRRVTQLKRRYLKSFTGVAENEITARLEELNHRGLLDEFR